MITWRAAITLDDDAYRAYLQQLFAGRATMPVRGDLSLNEMFKLQTRWQARFEAFLKAEAERVAEDVAFEDLDALELHCNWMDMAQPGLSEHLRAAITRRRERVAARAAGADSARMNPLDIQNRRRELLADLERQRRAAVALHDVILNAETVPADPDLLRELETLFDPEKIADAVGLIDVTDPRVAALESNVASLKDEPSASPRLRRRATSLLRTFARARARTANTEPDGGTAS